MDKQGTIYCSLYDNDHTVPAFNCLHEPLVNKALKVWQTRIYECVNDTSEAILQYKYT